MNTQIAVRLPDALVRAIDDWRRKELDVPARSDAIRRLLIVALKSDKPERKGRKP